MVITHGNREQSTTWVWTTHGNRKWIHEGGCEHRLKTNADQNDEMIERWAESLTTLSERGLAVETGRHVSHRHPETLTHDRQEGGGTIHRPTARAPEQTLLAPERSPDQELLQPPETIPIQSPRSIRDTHGRHRPADGADRGRRVPLDRVGRGTEPRARHTVH